MMNMCHLWRSFLHRQPKRRPYRKPRSKILDIEALEYRFGPTPTVEMALLSVGISLANPLAQPLTGPALMATPGDGQATVRALPVEETPADLSALTINLQHGAGPTDDPPKPSELEDIAQNHPQGSGNELANPLHSEIYADLFKDTRSPHPGGSGAAQGGGGASSEAG